MSDPDREFSTIRPLGCWDARRTGELLVPSEWVLCGYAGRMDVPHYEPREVAVLYTDRDVLAFADGAASPHRYSNGALCMWHPRDPTGQRWVPGDGLTDLLYRVRNHLIREAHWREYGEWLGDEYPHGKAA